MGSEVCGRKPPAVVHLNKPWCVPVRNSEGEPGGPSVPEPLNASAAPTLRAGAGWPRSLSAQEAANIRALVVPAPSEVLPLSISRRSGVLHHEFTGELASLCSAEGI